MTARRSTRVLELHVIVRIAPDGTERIATRSWAQGREEVRTDQRTSSRPFAETAEGLVSWAQHFLPRARAIAEERRSGRDFPLPGGGCIKGEKDGGE